MTLFSENPTKKILLEIIDFLRYKVATDQCTPEELRKFADVATNELDTMASTEEIADYYGQKLNNVHNVLKRRPIPKDKKPKKKIYFSFNLFATLKPKSWNKKEVD
jgi:hypothetical protein